MGEREGGGGGGEGRVGPPLDPTLGEGYAGIEWLHNGCTGNHTYSKFQEPLPVALHGAYSKDEDGMDALYAFLHRYSFLYSQLCLSMF